MAPIEVVRDGPVLRVWLNRPDKRNPLSGEVLEEIRRIFTSVNEDFDVRCVVLGGRGPAFSGGADRKAAPAPRSADPTARERRWVAQLGRRATRAIEDCEVPTIARLHGHVVGGAAVLALACDFRVASDDVSVWIPEVDLGIPLTWGAVPLLVRECGMARAREAIVVCDHIGGVDAERWGIVHRLVPSDGLDAAVDELAVRLASKPAAAIAMSKSQLRAYATTFRSGEIAELDGDLLLGAAMSDEARRAFGGGGGPR
jgi:enoyl-CoA hydratase/carnithine racemase